MKKETFIFRTEWIQYLDMLEPNDLSKCLHIIKDYVEENKEPETFNLNDRLLMVWTFIKNQLGKDLTKYDKRCETSKENGKNGGRPKNDENLKNLKNLNNLTKPKKPNIQNQNLKNPDNDYDNDYDNNHVTPYNPPMGNGEDNELFNTFWKEYPRKVSKGNAEKWFKRNKPDKYLVALMVEKLKVLKQSEQWSKENGKFIPYPASWLNAKGWEDEVKANDLKPKYDTTKIYYDEFMGHYKLDEKGGRIFV